MIVVDGVLRRLGAQPAERSMVLWASGCLLALGAAGFAILNTAEALFLKRVGVEALPLALMASSGLLVLTTATLGSLAASDPARWLPRVLAALALAPLFFVPLAGSESPLVFGALVLVARQLLALGMLAFWLAMGSLVPARRAKQLFAPLASGVTIGGIAGSFGSGPLVSWLGVEGLLSLGAGVLGVSAALSLRLRHTGTRQLEHALGDPGVRAASVARSNHWALFRESRLFRLLGVALLCGGALSPVLYFEFTSVLDAATQGPGGEQRLLDLYSQFRGWVNVAMLVSQLWLSAGLYRHLGLPLTLALWPLSYVVGFTWVGLDFALAAAFITFGAARVTEDGMSASAIRVLYNLFPDDVRARASGLLEGPVNRVGGMLGNGLVLVAISLGVASWVGWAALPFAVAWLATSLVLWRAYPGLLLRASAEHGLAGAGADRSVLLDVATLRSLAASLSDPDPRVCRAAIDLLVDGEPVTVVRLLCEALSRTPAANRPLLIAALRSLVEPSAPERTTSNEAVEALASALRSRPFLPAHERADLLQVYARLTSGAEGSEPMAQDAMVLLERLLGDRAAPVRLAAVVELHRRGAPPPGLPDLDDTIAQALGVPDAFIRRAGRKALRSLLVTSSPGPHWAEWLETLNLQLDQRADRADTAEALRDVARRHGAAVAPAAKDALRFVEDRDPRVRGALLAMVGHAGLAEEGQRLVSALCARAAEEADGAREGLLALGNDAALSLLMGLELAGASRRRIVVSLLRELEVDAATLESLRRDQLRSIQEVAVHRAGLDTLEDSLAALLRRRLEERITDGLGALLDLLAALHEDPRLAELERRWRRARSARDRDLLAEAIEVLLARSDSDVIIPLLEPGEWSQRGASAAAALGRPVPTSGEALAELRASADFTTRRIAELLSLEAPNAPGEPGSMRTIMDKAVQLQGMPVFDRLSTPQLVALSERLQEQRVEPGERLYAAGEEGVGLYFVLEGEIERRRGEVVLGRAGPGSLFGELAALDGLPRSADAIAKVASHLLRLDREDLMGLLDEVPELAIGMIQLLSSRVRSLEDRLDEGPESGEAS